MLCVGPLYSLGGKLSVNYKGSQAANNESSEVCGIIMPGRRNKINRFTGSKYPQTSDDSLFAFRPLVVVIVLLNILIYRMSWQIK